MEIESGPVWQTRNDTQIPNDPSGTRFSLVDLIGRGPWGVGRAYVTFNFNRRHAVRGLLAPFTVSGTGVPVNPVNFEGRTFSSVTPVVGTYQFNSYRLTYRYRFADGDRLKLWTGFTGKIRDARVQLDQGTATARNTNVGFVPLLHLAADWTLAPRVHALFDLDGLAGGPGRAFDVSVKIGVDLDDNWQLRSGYRTIEGGADVSSVFAFAWLHYAAVSLSYRP